MIRSATRRAVLGLAAAAGIALAAQAQAAEVEWKYYTYFAANDKPTQLHRQFAEAVEKASGGRFKIEVYAAGELPYKAQDVLRAVASKQIEMGDIAIGFVAGDVPQLNAFAMPFVCTSIDKFYDKGAAAAAPYLDEVLAGRFGVEPLMQWVMPPQQLWLRREVASIGELKGLKVRAWNREQVQMMELLGGTGVTITPAEVIPALERGVVDGAFTAAVPAYDWKFYEVVDFGYMLSFNLAHQVAAVNGSAYEALPEDLRAVLDETAQAFTAQYREAMIAGDGSAREKLVEAGMTLRDATPEENAKLRALTQPMWQSWAEANGETAQKMLAEVAEACK